MAAKTKGGRPSGKVVYDNLAFKDRLKRDTRNTWREMKKK